MCKGERISLSAPAASYELATAGQLAQGVGAHPCRVLCQVLPVEAEDAPLYVPNRSKCGQGKDSSRSCWGTCTSSLMGPQGASVTRYCC